ncbi:MAG: type II toxin-antitoxin system Phd/YefM family antitoxin [Tannerella sp.]|jgi:hypothetical protein|nr:type II toxin-antitoxin system Phd/YefM family antitoxin [Tannerella sp.]
MKTYNYADVTSKASDIFDAAMKEDVIVTWKNGSKFRLVSYNEHHSPFDVPCIDSDVSTQDILYAIADSRACI